MDEHATITTETLRTLHNEYQDAYGNACWRSKQVAAEVRYKAGTYHRDGRPVTLVNDDTEAWATANALRARLEAARVAHRKQNPDYYENAQRSAEFAASREAVIQQRLTQPPVVWGTTMSEPERTNAWQNRPAADRTSDPRSRATAP